MGIINRNRISNTPVDNEAPDFDLCPFLYRLGSVLDFLRNHPFTYLINTVNIIILLDRCVVLFVKLVSNCKGSYGKQIMN